MRARGRSSCDSSTSTARIETEHLADIQHRFQGQVVRGIARGRPVHLELWVKVKENWSDSEAALRQLGYES